MEIHKKQSMWNYPWYAFSLSLPVEKLVPEQHADFPGQTYKDTIPVLFWNRRDGYHRGVYAKGRMYGDDFSYKACSKEEMTRLWNYHIEHENAEPCYHLTPRGEPKKPEEAIYEVYLSKINPVEAYIKEMGGSWFCGGWKWKKTVKEILDDSNKQTCA